MNESATSPPADSIAAELVLWHTCACIGCGKALRSLEPDPHLPYCSERCGVVRAASDEMRDVIRRTLFWRPEDDAPADAGIVPPDPK